MYRLIQGDVGSGKTIIALLASIDVVKNGFQVVLMAPTEILARQHYEYFCEHLPEFSDQICLLTGKTKSKKNIYESILNDKIKILIGTHSVYNNDVKFKNLGLIIIDEQHKFGVKQRIKLLDKSRFCHTLIMSATPIPRSLSFVIYGEISISDIKTKPKGRKKVITTIINVEKIESLIEGIKRKIQMNEQIFWILPTINNEDLNSKETVTTRFQYLSKVFKNKVSMIHGKMKKEELNKTMNDFKNKEISILVSTTLIEVGVNIPSATLMVIERAEMFGLAQLHQLRGRIVRGNLQGNCVLIFSDNLSESTLQRLSILKSSENGFEIAEKDLEIRGAGDFFGTNQSGIPVWRFFNPSVDKKLIIESKEVSEDLVKEYNQNKEKIDFLREVFYRNENFMNYFSV
jgi:ATP-dependent DNA helicase RecG